jgi:hypothetical protein
MNGEKSWAWKVVPKKASRKVPRRIAEEATTTNPVLNQEENPVLSHPHPVLSHPHPVLSHLVFNRPMQMEAHHQARLKTKVEFCVIR